MEKLILLAVGVSMGLALGEILTGRLRQKPREWIEIVRSIWDATTAIALFAALVIFYLHPTFK